MEIELIKIEARKEDGVEATHLWFELTIDGKTYGDQVVLYNPSSYTKSMWQGIGNHISEHWETWAKKNNIEW